MQRLAAAALLVLALAGLPGAGSARLASRHRAGANPLRKVITMMQLMQKKVEEEGRDRKKLFDKFMCYCNSGTENLDKSIAAAEERIPQLESAIKEAEAQASQLTEELKQHKADRADAAAAIEENEAMTESDAKAYAEEEGSLKSNGGTIRSAIRAIRTGSGNFLQTSAASELKRLSVTVDMSGSDRDLLSSFLVGHASGSRDGDEMEVVGILEEMDASMIKELHEVEEEAATTAANHESLDVAKKAEMQVATRSIEEKTRRHGNLAVELVTLKNDEEDTSKALDEDKKFLADLAHSCEAKEAEWKDYQKEQADETVALAETIKILNADDALELFKKTLPSPAPSFLQLAETGEDTRQRALAALRAAPRRDPRIAFLEMAVRGQKQGFDALITKIDQLNALLRDEQKEDDNKKAFCNTEIDRAEDEVKASGRSSSDATTVIEDVKDRLEEVNRGIAALMDSIKELDKQVEEATATRQAEHAESVDVLAQNSAATSLLEMAKNRLFKYYNKNPSGQTSSSQQALLVQEHQGRSLDGQLPPAPEADLRYEKKTMESGSAVSMLDLLRNKLATKIAVLETEEKNAQADYERFIKDSSEKRALDSQTLADKEKNKAAIESTLLEEKDGLAAHQEAGDADKQELSSLHAECDWLLQNFELRKQARADEADSLLKAKAVLSGADFS